MLSQLSTLSLGLLLDLSQVSSTHAAVLTYQPACGDANQAVGSSLLHYNCYYPEGEYWELVFQLL